MNLLGWFVIAVGLAIGALVLAYFARRSRGRQCLSRTIMIVLGLVGMMLVWIGGFVLAVAYFFLQC